MNPVIHTAPLIHTDRGQRRATELNAVNTLVTGIFGTDAKVSHYEDGAPFISTRPDICISISHCIDRCVIAVSDRCIGVDIETARPTFERVASKFLTVAEQQRGPYPIATLMQLWSAKEAVFKCARIPSLVVADIEISPDFTTATVTHQGITRRFTLTYPLLTPDRVISIAQNKK